MLHGAVTYVNTDLGHDCMQHCFKLNVITLLSLILHVQLCLLMLDVASNVCGQAVQPAANDNQGICQRRQVILALLL